MSRVLEKEAASLRIQCMVGAIDRPAVVTWADDWLVRLNRPPFGLVEISTAQNLAAIIPHLQDLSGAIDDFEAVRLAAARLKAHSASSGSHTLEVAAFLYGVAVAHRYQVPEYAKFFLRYDDALDLASDGIYGVFEEVRNCFINELDLIAIE